MSIGYLDPLGQGNATGASAVCVCKVVLRVLFAYENRSPTSHFAPLSLPM